MIAPLDIFLVKNGEPEWLGSAETVQKALVLAAQGGEDLYFVFSQQTGHKHYYKVSSDGTVERTSGLE